MIFTYNKNMSVMSLMVIVKNSGDTKLDVERKGKVARVSSKKNGETVAWNILRFRACLKLQSAVRSFIR